MKAGTRPKTVGKRSARSLLMSTALPTATVVNWVTAGMVTPVRDQAACGE